MFGRILALVLTALLGGLAPLFVRRSERVLHLFVSFATGVFLGILFLHLLPEVGEMADLEGGASEMLVWSCVLLGVVGLYLLEKLVLSRREQADPHTVVGWGSFLGLCLHAFTSGVGLAAAATHPGLEGPVLLSLVSHKVAESFSLATVFLLGGLARKRIVALIVLFALITPAGLVAGSWLARYMNATGLQVFTALAAGTFLFVALCDLLPEVFHRREDTGKKLVLLAAGIAASMVLHLLDG